MSAELFHYRFFDYPNFCELIFNKEKYIIEQENKIRHNINVYLNNITISKIKELNRIAFESRNKSEANIKEIELSSIVSVTNNIVNSLILIITFYLGSIIGTINSFYSANIQGIISISKNNDIAKKMLDISKNYIVNNLTDVLGSTVIYMLFAIVVIYIIGYLITAYNKFKKLAVIELYEYQTKYCNFIINNKKHHRKKKKT